eukprot:5244320-Pyramimonas_sp.AAC.1
MRPGPKSVPRADSFLVLTVSFSACRAEIRLYCNCATVLQLTELPLCSQGEHGAVHDRAHFRAGIFAHSSQHQRSVCYLLGFPVTSITLFKSVKNSEENRILQW